MTNRMDCKTAAAALPDLLLDPSAAPATARAHVQDCPSCREELMGMQHTMAALDGWEAPEPSAFWMARMGARLREEQAAPRRGLAGFWERLRTRVWLSNVTTRTATAGATALALALAVGGGTWADLSLHPAAPAAVQASNTVRDLQSLDENAEVFQQLSAIDGPDTGSQGTD